MKEMHLSQNVAENFLLLNLNLLHVMRLITPQRKGSKTCLVTLFARHNKIPCLITLQRNIQGDQKVSVHLMITIQNVTYNVWAG
jgi:hypothetical protein